MLSYSYIRRLDLCRVRGIAQDLHDAAVRHIALVRDAPDGRTIPGGACRLGVEAVRHAVGAQPREKVRLRARHRKARVDAEDVSLRVHATVREAGIWHVQRVARGVEARQGREQERNHGASQKLTTHTH